MAEVGGIYKIQSIVKPERCYIGSSVDIPKRWYQHLSELKKNKHDNHKLQNHYNKYGKNDLVFSILICCDREDLIPTEQFYLDSIKTWFNIRTKADSNLGLSPSLETRKKLSDALKGKKRPWAKGKAAHNKGVPMSQEAREKLKETRKLQVMKPVSNETRDKIRIANKGRSYSPMSQETKKKISESNKGRTVSEETRRKIGEAQKGKKRPWQAGEKHHSYGKIYTPEERERFRQARMKQTSTRKGVPCSEETKQKLRLANLGKKKSEATKQKIRETQIRIGNNPPAAIGRPPWNKGLKKAEGAEGKITKLKVA